MAARPYRTKKIAICCYCNDINKGLSLRSNNFETGILKQSRELRAYLQSRLAGLLLLTLGLYYASSTLFFHTHIVNGQVVVHSHIFFKGHIDSSDEGEHTEDEVLLISYLNDILLVEQSMDCHLAAVDAPLESVAAVLSTTSSLFEGSSPRSLRAPPAVQLS